MVINKPFVSSIDGCRMRDGYRAGIEFAVGSKDADTITKELEAIMKNSDMPHATQMDDYVAGLLRGHKDATTAERGEAQFALKSLPLLCYDCPVSCYSVPEGLPDRVYVFRS